MEKEECLKMLRQELEETNKKQKWLEKGIEVIEEEDLKWVYFQVQIK